MKRFLICMLMVAACGGGAKPDGRVIRTDGGGVDAPDSAECNITANTGCDVGERCGWVRLQTTETLAAGKAACVPAGTVAENGTCTWGATGETTGFDNCVGGLYCLANPHTEANMGTCRTLCDTASATACGATGQCVTYADNLEPVGGGNAVAGVCDPTCNPLTQTRDSDGAADCGEGRNMDNLPNAGCYGVPSRNANPTKFSCAPAGDLAVDSIIADGTPLYINSCVPGTVPVFFDVQGSMNTRCRAYCDPVDTHMGAPAGANGMTPYGCADLGHAGAVECRYLWFFENVQQTPVTAASNNYGICWNYSDWDIDENMMPDPSCTTLVDDDMSPDGSQAWGCKARPAMAQPGNLPPSRNIVGATATILPSAK